MNEIKETKETNPVGPCGCGAKGQKMKIGHSCQPSALA
jgi:hypothetical protein